MESKKEVREKAIILSKRRRCGIIKPNFSSLIVIFEQIENNAQETLQGGLGCFSLDEVILDCIKNMDFAIFDEAEKWYLRKWWKEKETYTQFEKYDRNERKKCVTELFLLFIEMYESFNRSQGDRFEEFNAVYKKNENILRNIIKDAMLYKDFYVLENAIKMFKRFIRTYDIPWVCHDLIDMFAHVAIERYFEEELL